MKVNVKSNAHTHTHTGNLCVYVCAPEIGSSKISNRKRRRGTGSHTKLISPRRCSYNNNNNNKSPEKERHKDKLKKTESEREGGEGEQGKGNN